MVAVDVTKNNFKQVLPAVKRALERCAFYAVDCEMTGLQTESGKPEYMDDIQARYSKLAESSRSFIITQYGLSCFELTGPNTYEASTFNFFVFPQPHGNYCRKFLCDASSLAFLSAHGFDFNTCIGQGVPYMPVRTRDWQLTQLSRNDEPRSFPAVPSTPEDKAFVQDLIQLVTDWLAGKPINNSALHLEGGFSTDDEVAAMSADEHAPAAAAQDGAAAEQQQQQQAGVLVLAPMNSFRRLLAHQELRKAQFGVEGHPGFWVTKGEDSRSLVLVRASAQQAAALEEEARSARITAIHDAAGFAAVFDLMRAAHKPCVGHNCMYDISYGIYSFADSYLPASWQDYKKMVRAWHPGGIWDTKYLAKRLPEVFGDDTALAQVYGTTSQPTPVVAAAMEPLLSAASAAAGQTIQLPRISHAPGFDKYKGLAAGEAAHEAGYDAFMTGAAFAALMPLVAGKVASDPHSELAAAYQNACIKAATTPNPAASAAAGSPYSSLLLSASRAQQQQQQQGLSPLQQQAPLAAAAAAAGSSTPNGASIQQQQQQSPVQVQQDPTAGLMQYVAGAVGRLNLTYTDITYAALWEEDPIPERPCTFHVTGLQPGYRVDDVWRMMKRQGLGTPRITALDSNSCLATFAPDVAPAVPAALAELEVVTLVVTPWADYAKIRYQSKLPDEQQQGTAAGDDGRTPPQSLRANGGAEGYASPAKRPRIDGAFGATVAHTAVDPAGGDEAERHSHEPGSSPEVVGGPEGQADGKNCTIM